MVIIDRCHQLDFPLAGFTQSDLFQCVLFQVNSVLGKNNTARVTFADNSLVNVILVAGLAGAIPVEPLHTRYSFLVFR